MSSPLLDQLVTRVTLENKFSHRCQWLPEVRYSSLPMLHPRPPAFQKMYLQDRILVRADHHHDDDHHQHPHHCQPILGSMLEHGPPWSPFDKVRRRETEISMRNKDYNDHADETAKTISLHDHAAEVGGHIMQPGSISTRKLKI